jgi:hypothetical protein
MSGRVPLGQNKRSTLGLNQLCLQYLALAHDLIRLPKLAYLALQLLDPLAYCVRRTIPRFAVLFRLPNPAPQCLWDAAIFGAVAATAADCVS